MDIADRDGDGSVDYTELVKVVNMRDQMDGMQVGLDRPEHPQSARHTHTHTYIHTQHTHSFLVAYSNDSEQPLFQSQLTPPVSLQLDLKKENDAMENRLAAAAKEAFEKKSSVMSRNVSELEGMLKRSQQQLSSAQV